MTTTETRSDTDVVDASQVVNTKIKTPAPPAPDLRSLRARITESQVALAFEDIPIPDWGVVRVKEMTAADRAALIDNYSDAATGRLQLKAMYPALLCLCTYDPEDDSRVFLPGDETMILAQKASNVEALASVALRLSALDSKAEERLGKSS